MLQIVPASSETPRPGWLAFTLELNEPHGGRLTGVPFTHKGAQFAREGTDTCLRVRVHAAPCVTAETLLDFCAAWLSLPAASLSVKGTRLVLSSGVPERTVADAGFGSPAEAVHPVFSLPFCSICFDAAASSTWTCRSSTEAHAFCTPCMEKYARMSLCELNKALLRCPAPGCAHTLPADQVSRLVPAEQVAASRRQRVAEHNARLQRIRDGHEVRLRMPNGMRRRNTHALRALHTPGRGAAETVVQVLCARLSRVPSGHRQGRGLPPRHLFCLRGGVHLGLRGACHVPKDGWAKKGKTPRRACETSPSSP